MAPQQRVLLTGATGHVGGHLFRHLSAVPSIATHALVRSPRPLPDWAARAEVTFADISKSEVFATALQGVDTVVHLATRGYSAAVLPTATELATEQRTATALVQAAIRAGVSRFIFLSSIHVYGNSLIGVVDDDTPPSPTTEYGRSRQSIEHALLAATRDSATTVVLLRLTNSFGTPAIPRPETWNLLLHDLCRQVVETSTISLRSDARLRRDVIALRDVVQVLTQVITSPSISHGVHLIASGQSLQLGEWAAVVQRLARETLGMDVSINCRVNEGFPPPAYTLVPRKLREVGVTIPDQREAEIRDLLRFALQEFGAGRQ